MSFLGNLAAQIITFFGLSLRLGINLATVVHGSLGSFPVLVYRLSLVDFNVLLL